AAARGRRVLPAAADGAGTLFARTPGRWGNCIVVSVAAPTGTVRVPVTETVTVATGTDPQLRHHPGIVNDPRTRIRLTPAGSAVAVDRAPVFAAPTDPNQVQIGTDGKLVFPAGAAPKADDRFEATYVVGEANPTVARLRPV